MYFGSWKDVKLYVHSNLRLQNLHRNNLTKKPANSADHFRTSEKYSCTIDPTFLAFIEFEGQMPSLPRLIINIVGIRLPGG